MRNAPVFGVYAKIMDFTDADNNNILVFRHKRLIVIIIKVLPVVAQQKMRQGTFLKVSTEHVHQILL